MLDADTPTSTGTILFARRFPERFINLGISEQDMVSTAAGLAIAGKKPVAAAFSMFLMRAWEQIRNTVARDRLNVTLVGTHAGFSDFMDGASPQCFEDIALTRVLPGFTVVAPADAAAARDLVRRAVAEHAGPVYIRLGRENSPGIYGEGEEFPIGGSRILEDAGDVLLVSYGPILGVTLEVARLLRRQGVGAGDLDLYTLKPVDKDALVSQASRSALVVTVEDHSVHGGLGSIVAETLSEHSPTRVLRIGVEDRFGASSRSYRELLEYMGFTPERLAERIRGELDGA